MRSAPPCRWRGGDIDETAYILIAKCLRERWDGSGWRRTGGLIGRRLPLYGGRARLEGTEAVALYVGG